MKLFLILSLTALLAACSPPVAQHEPPAENGAQFKSGRGLALTDKMKQSLGLRVAEVGEARVAPSFTVALLATLDGDGLQPVSHPGTTAFASGWITTAQAAAIRPGMEIALRTAGGGTSPGVVRRIDRERFAIGGDFAVTVQSETPLALGSRVTARFQLAEGEAVTTIPRSALLTTAEGNFVYALNDGFYVRTPVKLGAQNEDRVEIADGLYTGDDIVIEPVMPLWLAELQILRGGLACCQGH